MKAYKLINTPDNNCDFLEGSVPSMAKFEASYFFLQHHIEAYEISAHPAPRYQFVITLKGKLKFKVSNGSSFIIEPGVILIASDLKGEGHTWELIEGDIWERIYIVTPDDSPDHFIVNETTI